MQRIPGLLRLLAPFVGVVQFTPNLFKLGLEPFRFFPSVIGSGFKFLLSLPEF